jgi:Phosphotransferase enzyme family
MCTPIQLDQDVFRILLYRNDATELLLQTTSDGLCTPTVQIPAHTRLAEEITAAIKRKWNFETYCLFTVPPGDPSRVPIQYQVAESCRPEATPPVGMRWLPVASLNVDAFEDPEDFWVVETSLTRLGQHRQGELPGAFGKPGWLQSVTEWVAGRAAAFGLRLTGKFRQFNASPTFSLLRFETNGAALWFKAVGEPNAHECAITLHLGRILPGHVPQVIASNLEWNAWLSVEAEGHHLGSMSPIGEWQIVATALADLQIASFGNGLHLIETGCRDVRVCFLLERVDQFVDCMAELMERQPKPSPPPLTRLELTSLAEEICKALEELNEVRNPNTLGHLDCGPANIVVSQERCVFLDWAEGCVGHPFFTFQYLLEHWRRFHGTGANAESTILSAYTTAWQSFVPLRDIAADLRVMPLLAAFAYAASNEVWRNADISHRPEVAAFLRSLTRRMKREAEALQQRRLICIP